jgi:hypothetical protein
MKASYDRIAGQSVERLAALSDGVFAVSICRGDDAASPGLDRAGGSRGDERA